MNIISKLFDDIDHLVIFRYINNKLPKGTIITQVVQTPIIENNNTVKNLVTVQGGISNIYRIIDNITNIKNLYK